MDSEYDPYGVVPESFLDDYDADTIPEALETAERRPSTTDPDDLSRCPECGSTQIKRKVAHDHSDRQPGNWRCTCCWRHFDDPAHGMIPRENRGTPFSWIDDDDLHDAEDRTELQPPLAQLDEDALVTAVIRLYQPWREAGPSYRDLAPYTPYTREWVGSRIRAWRDGEYRDLVPDPTAEQTCVSQENGEPAEGRPGGCHRIPEAADEAA